MRLYGVEPVTPLRLLEEITGSVLLIIFYVENLDVGSWGVKNDV